MQDSGIKCWPPKMLRINPYAGHLVLFLIQKIEIYRHKESCDRHYALTASGPAHPPKAGLGAVFSIARNQ